MNINKHFKKFVVALLLIVLFNFCFPKATHAWILEDLKREIVAAPAKIFWMAEKGILIFLNNTFTKEEFHTTDDQLEIFLTPETIIRGNFILFDANIFTDSSKYDENSSKYYDYDANAGEGVVLSGRQDLRDTIAGWYVSIRNFTIVGLLSVLVYVGIRMILSTLAQDKAKYKAMFKDWLIALCLVVMMHYIMIGILNLSSTITEALGGGRASQVLPRLTDNITNILSADEYTYTNEEDNKEYDIGDAYALIFVVCGIIVYTVIFAIRYLKREFTILFLIIIGPAACLTYPIDKIGDGKAQAYNRWFTEFLYQVIIQPFHLLIYIVLIGTASELADTNAIYALVCFAVMKPAETFIKEMFGFKDKLGSPLGNLMKAGMARDLVSKATSRIMSGKGGNSGNRGSGENTGNNDEYNSAPPIQNRNVDNEMLGGGAENSQDAGNSRQRHSIGDGGQQERSTPAEQMLEADLENGDISPEEYDQRQREIAREKIEAAQKKAEQDADDRRVMQELREDGHSDEEIADILGRDVSELSELSGNAAAVATLNESEAQNSSIPHGQTEADRAQGIQEQQRQLEGWRATRARRRAVHARRMANKYGTTRRGKQWRRRVGRGLGKGIKTIAKGSLIATAALAGAGIAAASGNGAEALAVLSGAAALGVHSGARTIRGFARSASRTARDYYRNDAFPVVSRIANNFGFNDPDQRAFDEFESDPDQMRRAEQRYRLNHDGVGPNASQLRDEMRDRFELARYGLSNDQIDKAIGRYQELKNTRGISDYKAQNIAAIEAELADANKGKFGKQKEVQDMINSLTKRFENEGVDHATAQASALRYLDGAAKMNKETLVLPDGMSVVEAEVRIPNVSEQLGIQGGRWDSEINAERMNNITVKLMEMDYTPSEIQRIAESVAEPGDTQLNILEKYDARVEMIGRQHNSARARVAETKHIEQTKVKNQDIKMEVNKGLELTDTRNVPEKNIDKVRKIEQRAENKKFTLEKKAEVKTQNEVAWKYADKIKKEGIDKIGEFEKELKKQLQNGGSTEAQARKDARRTINQAKQLNKYSND